MIRLASLALSSNRAALAGPPSLARGSAAEAAFAGSSPMAGSRRWLRNDGNGQTRWQRTVASLTGGTVLCSCLQLSVSTTAAVRAAAAPTVISELAVADDLRAGRPPAGPLREPYRGRHPKQQMRPRARLRPGAAQDLVAESAPGHSNVSAANEIAGSQTGSQRPQAQGCARPPPAIPAAVERHVRPRPAPSRHTSKVPPKQ